MHERRIIEWILVAGCVCLFSSLIYLGFKRWELQRMVIGDDVKVPIRLPLFSFAWTVATAVAFFAWREGAGSADAELIHRFYRVGWDPSLVLFNIRIDRWWAYAIILCYQVARAVLSSLLNNIYLPWLHGLLYTPPSTDSRPLSERERRLALTGQALATASAWWSSVTNIITSVSQVDLALIALAAGVACDAELSVQFLEARATALRAMAASGTGLAPLQAGKMRAAFTL